MIDRRFVGDANLSALQNRRHRNDEREVFRFAFEVARHREDRAVLIAHEHDLRCVVEQLGVAARYVEAAERVRIRSNECESEGDDGNVSKHDEVLHSNRGARSARSMSGTSGDAATSDHSSALV